jgi:SH3-like domain-containing protein
MIRARWALLAAAILGAMAVLSDGWHAHAQPAPAAGGAPEATVRPKPRPGPPPAPPVEAPPPVGTEAPVADDPPVLAATPTRGPVTNMPLPRYVSLKGKEGNARRGPGLTNRIDWVFTHAGMPLRVTAEHENWRRVEDAEGMGGWVHYALLSGVRTILVTAGMAEFHVRPDPASEVLFKAEAGVIGRILECGPDWCRISIEGEKGWAVKSQFWGSDPGEIVE